MRKTFPKGGVHPPENKITAFQPIRKLPTPKQVYVPIAQHIGIPSEIVVTKNEQVHIGQVIAKASGFVSTNIHAPVAGKVTKLDKFIDSRGYRKQCIVIKTDTDNPENFQDVVYPLKQEIVLKAPEILKRITEYGIVGLGGATFPTHVKLNVNKENRLDYILINGVECEPYLTADHRLMLERAPEIIVGIRILQKALHIKKAIIGIENNKQNAVEKFKELTRDNPDISVASLTVKYPQGSEKQLIKSILNREVPKGKLPKDVGVLVHNVGTVYAIYQAVQHDKPLIERVVSVTGKSLKEPSNFWVKIGTPIRDLIDAVGGVPDDTRKILNGGPMMGKAVKNLDVPITKACSGIVLLSGKEAHRGTPTNCIRCADCVHVCPMGLEPHLLMDLCLHHQFESALKEDILTCIECGSCSYTCPSHRPLLDYIRFGKKLVKENKAV